MKNRYPILDCALYRESIAHVVVLDACVVSAPIELAPRTSGCITGVSAPNRSTRETEPKTRVAAPTKPTTRRVSHPQPQPPSRIPFPSRKVSFRLDRDRRRVSRNGGNGARWRRDSKELFFLSPDRQIMSAAVKQGTGIEFGPPAALFRLPTSYRSFGPGDPRI
jgi:hypothetical protein